MEIKYIIKSASSNRPFFLVRDVEIFNGKIVPFAFRNCEQQEWNIPSSTQKKRPLPLVKKQENMMAQIIHL